MFEHSFAPLVASASLFLIGCGANPSATPPTDLLPLFSEKITDVSVTFGGKSANGEALRLTTEQRIVTRGTGKLGAGFVGGTGPIPGSAPGSVPDPNNRGKTSVTHFNGKEIISVPEGEPLIIDVMFFRRTDKHPKGEPASEPRIQLAGCDRSKGTVNFAGEISAPKQPGKYELRVYLYEPPAGQDSRKQGLNFGVGYPIWRCFADVSQSVNK